MEKEAQKIIITITGADKIGIVAKITQVLADCEANIEDIRQSIMQGHFIMMMLCDIAKSKKSFKEIKEILTKKMETSAKAENFETALILREKIKETLTCFYQD